MKREWAFWLVVAGCFVFLAGYSWVSSLFFGAALWAWSRKGDDQP